MKNRVVLALMLFLSLAGVVRAEKPVSPNILQLAEQLKARQFEFLAEQLARQDQSMERADNGEYVFRKDLDSASDYFTKKAEEFLPLLSEWVSLSPDSYVAHLMRGQFYVNYAWEARGSGYASSVTEQGAQLFLDRLALARTDLYKAYQLNRRSTTALGWLIVSSRGLGSGEEEKFFNLGVKINPADFDLHRIYMESLKPKWGGTDEGMFDFARQAAKKNSTEPLFGLLVVEAHREYAWMNFSDKNDNGQSYADYFGKPAVWTELEKIFESVVKAYPNSAYFHNRYAYYAYITKHFRTAHREIQFVGDQWEGGYLGESWESAEVYYQVRDWLNQAAAAGQLPS